MEGGGGGSKMSAPSASGLLVELLERLSTAYFFPTNGREDHVT